MAEAMCGPSNALQQFKQQTDIDRTLERDRLTSRHPPADAFRSHNPNAAFLDQQFEAFQAGLDPGLFNQGPTVPPQAAAFAGPASQAPSWATDFQRMHISSPAPVQPHFQPGPSTSDWAHGFREHIAHAAPRAQSSSPSPLAFQQRARGFGGNFGYQPPAFSQQAAFPAQLQSKGKEPMLADQLDSAAFDRAFDQARDDMMADVEPSTQSMNIEEIVDNVHAVAEQEATSMLQQSHRDMEEMFPEEQLPAIHTSDTEYRPEQTPLQEQTPEQQQQHEDDALAATAGELLQKVEHNQTDKFRNSNFLNLMRKLRDREMRVEGDHMVETATASSTSLADDTLNASSTASAERIYYGKPQPVPLSMGVNIQSIAESNRSIPQQEQDHDPGRIDPKDGQEVVNLLSQRGLLTEDMVSASPLPEYNPEFAESLFLHDGFVTPPGYH